MFYFVMLYGVYISHYFASKHYAMVTHHISFVYFYGIIYVALCVHVCLGSISAVLDVLIQCDIVIIAILKLIMLRNTN